MVDHFAIMVDKQNSNKMSARRHKINPRSSTLNSKTSWNKFPDRQSFPCKSWFQSPRVSLGKKQHSKFEKNKTITKNVLTTAKSSKNLVKLSSQNSVNLGSWRNELL